MRDPQPDAWVVGMRQEFPVAVKREALQRSGGQCEAVVDLSSQARVWPGKAGRWSGTLGSRLSSGLHSCAETAFVIAAAAMATRIFEIMVSATCKKRADA